MKTQRMKNVLSAVCFILILAFMVHAISYITWDKGGKSIYLYRQEEPDSLDVVFVGASQVMCGVYPMDLYHDFGITSYDYVASATVLPQSYYNIVEALKTQSPKVLVLDVSGVIFQTKIGSIEFTHGQLDNMEWSQNKLQAISDLIETPGDRLEFYIPLIRFHTRWKDLDRVDLQPITGTAKGAAVMDGHVEDLQEVKAVPRDAMRQIPEVTEEYLRKSLDYCREQGVPVLLLTTPVVNDTFREYYNSVDAIAEEYGVRYLNLTYCLDEMDFDFTTDMRDNNHCNIQGAQKVTAYVGSYLKEHYDLPDRRSDESCAQAWDRAYLEYKAEYPY